MQPADGSLRDLAMALTDIRFDRRTVIVGRRGVLAALLGALTIACPSDAVDAGPADPFCDEKEKGGRCRRSGQCCSGRCKKKKGKCLCSTLRTRCSASTDCCGHLTSNSSTPQCKTKSGADVAHCRFDTTGAPCQEHEDCCGIMSCGAGGACDL